MLRLYFSATKLDNLYPHMCSLTLYHECYWGLIIFAASKTNKV